MCVVRERGLQVQEARLFLVVVFRRSELVTSRCRHIIHRDRAAPTCCRATEPPWTRPTHSLVRAAPTLLPCHRASVDAVDTFGLASVQLRERRRADRHISWPCMPLKYLPSVLADRPWTALRGAELLILLGWQQNNFLCNNFLPLLLTALPACFVQGGGGRDGAVSLLAAATSVTISLCLDGSLTMHPAHSSAFYSSSRRAPFRSPLCL